MFALCVLSIDINTPDASLNTMCRTVSPIVPLVLTNTIILESIPSQPFRAHPTRDTKYTTTQKGRKITEYNRVRY